MIHADFTELYQWNGRLDRGAGDVTKKASAAVRKTAHDIVASSQRFAPVDTGAMRSSIHTVFPDAARLTADIGPTVHYAPYVEFGTIQNRAQPFMGPALDRHAPDLAEALRIIGGDL